MRFTEALLRQHGLRRPAIRRLRRRRTGGESGALGYEYQRRYAMLRLLQLAGTPAGGTVSMESLCPVDDVVVEQPGQDDEHAQCKTTPSTSWSARRGKLRREFEVQSRLMTSAQVPYLLRLVVPDAAHAARLAKARPKSLQKSSVDVHCFPHPSPLTEPWQGPQVKVALDALIPEKLRGTSQREHVYRMMNHVAGAPWHEGLQASACVRDACERAPTLPIQGPPSRVTAATLAAAQAIWAAIPQLHVESQGTVYWFRHGHETRLIGRSDTEPFDRFLGRVVQVRPTTVDAFYGVLP